MMRIFINPDHVIFEAEVIDLTENVNEKLMLISNSIYLALLKHFWVGACRISLLLVRILGRLRTKQRVLSGGALSALNFHLTH